MVNIRKLEADLWESADLLRAESKLTSNQYCMPVLGLIFLRYAYSRFKLVETEIMANRPVRNGKKMPVSELDFREKSALYLLRREFFKTKNKHLMMKDLDELVQQRIDSMLKTNPNRINFYERYKKIIEDYNKEQNRAEIERIFDELMKLANSLNDEEQRHVRENFHDDEQLAIYDLMFQDDLSAKDIKKIKEVAVELLDKIKSAIATIDHCFDKDDGQAAIQKIIRDTLYEELPDSVFDNFEVYQVKIYDYVYTRYKNVA